MILTPHLLLAAAIASKIKYPPLAIVLAFLSHYLLDLIPHVEYSIDNISEKRWQKSLPDILRVFLDFSLGMLLILIFSNNRPIVYTCALIALIPDSLTIINSIFPNKILKIHNNIHQRKIHFLKYKKTRALNELSARPSTKNIIFSALVSIPFRILSQVATVFISILLLN